MAHMVWETFSDALSDPAILKLLALAGLTMDNGLPPERTADELLILHLWAHTRSVQIGLGDRLDPLDVRYILDAFHGAIFDDLKALGSSAGELSIFEQRTAARYQDYYAAAEVSDLALGSAAAAHLRAQGGVEFDTDPPAPHRDLVARFLARRARELAQPFVDFLTDVHLTGPPTHPRRPRPDRRSGP